MQPNGHNLTPAMSDQPHSQRTLAAVLPLLGLGAAAAGAAGRDREPRRRNFEADPYDIATAPRDAQGVPLHPNEVSLPVSSLIPINI
jgi:hypothetical protein